VVRIFLRADHGIARAVSLGGNMHSDGSTQGVRRRVALSPAPQCSVHPQGTCIGGVIGTSEDEDHMIELWIRNVAPAADATIVRRISSLVGGGQDGA
jgi:hypothetical protein